METTDPDYGRAMARLITGEWAEALKIVTSMLGDRDSADLLWTRAAIYQRMGQHQLAARDAESASQTVWHAPAAMAAAFEFLHSNADYDGALSVARVMEERHASSEHGIVWKAIVEITQERLIDARATLRRALDRNERSEPALTQSGRLFLRLGEAEEAIRSCEAALSVNAKSAKAWCYWALAHKRMGNIERAIDGYSRAIEVDPENIGAINNRGTCWARLGKFADAERDLTRALALNPGAADVLLNRARVRLRAGSHLAALGDVEVVIGQGAGDAEARLLSARARLALSQFEKARIELIELRGLAGVNRAECTDVEVRVCWALGQRGMALNLLGNMPQASMPAELMRLQGATKVALGMHSEGIEDLDRAIAVNPGDAESWHDRGWAKYLRGNLLEGLIDMKKAVDVEPQSARYWNALGAILIGMGNLEEARDAFRSSLSRDEWYWEARTNLAMALLRLGDASGAIEEASRVLMANRECPRALLIRIRARRQIEGFAGVVEDMESLAGHAVYVREYYVLKGRMFLEHQEWVKASGCYSIALGIDPQCQEAVDGMACAREERGLSPGVDGMGKPSGPMPAG